MTKEKLQQELKEKVKAGVKPSDIKRLKKSKSTGDLPNTPKSQPLQHSKSTNELPLVQPSLEEQNIQLKEQVKFHAQTAANYLSSLQSSQAKVSELEENEKKDKQTISELKDQILELRLENIQDFGKYLDQLKAVESDLTSQIQDDQQEIKELEKRVNLLTKERTCLQRDKSLAELKLSNLELGEGSNNSD